MNQTGVWLTNAHNQISLTHYMKSQTVYAVIRAFSTEPHPRQNTFKVCPCGTVKVFDNVAHMFTTCHSISEEDQQKIRHLAAQVSIPNV